MSNFYEDLLVNADKNIKQLVIKYWENIWYIKQEGSLNIQAAHFATL